MKLRQLLFVYWMVFGAKGVNLPKQLPLCKGGRRMDGWTFFSRNLSFIMMVRNYDPPGGIQDSLCVKAPFNATVRDHVVNKTFTYRNLSSTYKLDDTGPSSVTFWPIAKMKMTFRMDSIKHKFNFVNSTMIYSQYHSTPNGKPLCEVWINVKQNAASEHILVRKTNWTCCYAYFRAHCDTTYMAYVYDDNYCSQRVLKSRLEH
uniref:Lipocalin n=1 Tax=Amblyomma maculatum TaxID=34609 RepID=G3MLX7_AMBMU